ncbi:MAG TPA: Hsp20/alpha crystallin family protein [Candidatus Bathyarchaeia archaeon]|nr:Hsp20/alpha crystallin family protein [Candidatus Bathyarchaeia archaeon]
MAIVKYTRDPWRALETLNDELTGLLGAPLGAFPALGRSLSAPSLDVSEDESNIYVEADIPGIDGKDIDISLRHDNELTISAKKERQEEKKGKNYFRSERYYGEYYREVDLPKPVDASKIKATMKNGVLAITLPKKEIEKERQVRIRVE